MADVPALQRPRHGHPGGRRQSPPQHAEDGAAVLGVCEVENRAVLEDLVKQPDIKNRQYEIVHYDSPDRRGIDVALLYNPALFVVTNSKAYKHITDDENFRTRDQLMVSGYLQNEKIHVILEVLEIKIEFLKLLNKFITFGDLVINIYLMFF